MGSAGVSGGKEGPLRAFTLVAGGLALAGEELIGTGRAPWVGSGAQLAASGLFAWGAWPRPAPPATMSPMRRPGTARLLAFPAAAAGAVAANLWCPRLL